MIKFDGQHPFLESREEELTRLILEARLSEIDLLVTSGPLFPLDEDSSEEDVSLTKREIDARKEAVKAKNQTNIETLLQKKLDDSTPKLDNINAEKSKISSR